MNMNAQFCSQRNCMEALLKKSKQVFDNLRISHLMLGETIFILFFLFEKRAHTYLSTSNVFFAEVILLLGMLGAAVLFFAFRFYRKRMKLFALLIKKGKSDHSSGLELMPHQLN
jgi:hypothetical protein